MLSKENKEIKYKRILMACEELEKFGLSLEKTSEYVQYFFNISPLILTRILKKYSVEDFNHVHLPCWDADKAAIMVFVDMHFRKATQCFAPPKIRKTVKAKYQIIR